MGFAACAWQILDPTTLSRVPSSPSARPRPTHLRLRFLGLVGAGGVVGTAARQAISLAVPDIDGLPVAILLVNILGAFTLGVLIERLARPGADHGRRRALRLFFGTGVLGGFTTYSALAAETALLVGEGRLLVGVGYGLVTVVVGAAACWCGVWLGARSLSRGRGQGHCQGGAA